MMARIAGGAGVSDDIDQKVIELIARKKKLDVATITPDSTFEQLGIDSLDATDLLFAFEDSFGIVVPDEMARSMTTVRQVADGVRRLITASPEAS
jgi:acyl carrier protein